MRISDWSSDVCSSDLRTDCAGRAVHKDAPPRLKAAVLEQSLPRGEARDWQARGHREVDVARQRREVACLDGYRLRQGAVAMPVGEAEHSLSYRQSRRAVARSEEHTSELQSLMRNSYAVFCLKQKNKPIQ